MSKHKHSEKAEKEIKKSEERAEVKEEKVDFEELLAQEQKAHEELKQQFMRIAAEYDNFRKRSVKEKEQIYPEAISYAVSQFLSVADSAQAAMALDIKDSECPGKLLSRSVFMYLLYNVENDEQDLLMEALWDNNNLDQKITKKIVDDEIDKILE